VFARVGTYTIQSDRMDDAVKGFESALDRIRGLDGYKRGLILVSPEDDKAISITFWETREAMESSRVAASRARSDAARAADGEVESSGEYVIALRI
jgi:heme-degrading monooxygenase HmoA